MKQLGYLIEILRTKGYVEKYSTRNWMLIKSIDLSKNQLIDLTYDKNLFQNKKNN